MEAATAIIVIVVLTAVAVLVQYAIIRTAVVHGIIAADRKRGRIH